MGDLEFSCGAFGRAAMTALTDQGLGFGRDDVCGMALAAAKAMTVKALAGEANCTQIFKLRTWYCVLSHLATTGRFFLRCWVACGVVSTTIVHESDCKGFLCLYKPIRFVSQLNKARRAGRRTGWMRVYLAARYRHLGNL
jgi:hypothetical protein